MKILVPGGAGYIGSHTCVELLNAGYEVAVVDNYANSTPRVFPRIEQITGKRFSVYEADIGDEAALRRIFEKEEPDAVIHFAGFKSAPGSVAAPIAYYTNNLSGTVTLFRVMEAFGVKKIVFSSSACVYGNMEHIPLREDEPTAPLNPYGQIKLMTERIMHDMCIADDTFAAVALRYFNPIGAHPSGLIGENPLGEPGNLAPRILQAAIGKTLYITVTGTDFPTPDGTGVRDYLHVVDLARGHVKALEYLNTHAGFLAVNLGTGRGTSVMELLHAFERAVGHEIPYKNFPRRDGDAPQYWADPSLAEKLFSWRTELSIDDMCRDAWRWQSHNPNGYAD